MKKLAYQKQSEIFQKTIRQNGKLFQVRFVIVEKNGKLRGKIISCEPIEVLGGSGVATEQHCLPLFSPTQAFPEETIRFRKVVPPFSSFDFLTSIQIRAPSFDF